MIGLEYERQHISNFKEKHSNLYDLKLHGQNQDSLLGKIGAQLFWRSCECGILPFAEVYYEHEFLRPGKTLEARFRHDDDIAINFIRTSSPERDSVTYAIGIYTDLCDCLSANISYEGDTTFRQYTNSVRAEIDFRF